jgi:flagellar protein FliL
MADDDLESQEKAQKKGARNKLLLIIVLLLVIGGAGGGAAWFFLLAPGDAETATAEGEEAEAEAAPPEPMQYLSLAPPFVVNFPYQGRQRYLQAEISVMSRDAAALEALRLHMPAVRHALNNLFSAQLILVFEDPSGIEALRELATAEVRQVLEREIGRPGIEEVLFTSFVMQ